MDFSWTWRGLLSDPRPGQGGIGRALGGIGRALVNHFRGHWWGIGGHWRALRGIGAAAVERLASRARASRDAETPRPPRVLSQAAATSRSRREPPTNGRKYENPADLTAFIILKRDRTAGATLSPPPAWGARGAAWVGGVRGGEGSRILQGAALSLRRPLQRPERGIGRGRGPKNRTWLFRSLIQWSE